MVVHILIRFRVDQAEVFRDVRLIMSFVRIVKNIRGLRKVTGALTGLVEVASLGFVSTNFL